MNNYAEIAQRTLDVLKPNFPKGMQFRVRFEGKENFVVYTGLTDSRYNTKQAFLTLRDDLETSEIESVIIYLLAEIKHPQSMSKRVALTYRFREQLIAQK